MMKQGRRGRGYKCPICKQIVPLIHVFSEGKCSPPDPRYPPPVIIEQKPEGEQMRFGATA
jgi:hypothetical protein